MKRRIDFFCLYCCALCLLISCNNYNKYKVLHLLDNAEILMNEQPDSAYTLLSDLEVDRIPTSSLRAQFALLYTQALEKTRRPMGSDSLICMAVDYYTRKDYLIRKAYALFYQGCVWVETNNIEASFQSFKQAQDLAKELKDDYLLGLSSVNLAELYQKQYHFETALELLKQALAAYKRADKEKHVCYTLIMIGKLYLLNNIDSSAHYCRIAYEQAVELQDFEYEYSVLMNMYSVYMKQKEYTLAKDLLFDNVHRFNKDGNKKSDMILQISVLYYNMGELDSARHYISLVALDSLEAQKRPGVLLLMKLIEEELGNYKAALEYYNKYKSISDEILQQLQEDDLKKAEERYNREKLKSENYSLRYRVLSMIILLMVASMVTFLSVRLIVKHLKMRAKFHEEHLMKMSILREDELIARSKIRENQLKQIVEHRFSVIKGLLDLSYIRDPHSHKFLERFRHSMALSGKPDETFFADLLPLMNNFYYGAIDWLKEHYSDLVDSDIELICLLFFKFSPQELCVLYGLEHVGAIYTRCSRVAKKLKIDKGISIGSFLEEKIEELRVEKSI